MNREIPTVDLREAYTSHTVREVTSPLRLKLIILLLLRGLIMKIQNLTGNEYGKLKVIKRSPARKDKNGEKQAYWECGCSCMPNRRFIVKDSHLLSGKVTCCGCGLHDEIMKKAVEEGVVNEYREWFLMRERCYDPNNPRYEGGDGAYVCEEWIVSFDQFLKDMGPMFDEAKPTGQLVPFPK